MGRALAARPFSCFLRDLRAFLEEFQRSRIEAIALSGRGRAVGKYVALMAAASCTTDLDPSHTVTGVFDIRQMLLVEWSVKRRPPGSAVELVLRREQRQSAQPAGIRAVELIVEQRSAERSLGAMVEQYPILLFIQILCEPVDRFLIQGFNVVAAVGAVSS